VENFQEIFHNGKISVAYFYILQLPGRQSSLALSGSLSRRRTTLISKFQPGQMELISLGRQSVYPRVYLASYRGTSLAMETMRRSSNRNSVNNVNTASAFSSSGASDTGLLEAREAAQDGVYWRMFTKHSATHS